MNGTKRNAEKNWRSHRHRDTYTHSAGSDATPTSTSSSSTVLWLCLGWEWERERVWESARVGEGGELLLLLLLLSATWLHCSLARTLFWVICLCVSVCVCVVSCCHSEAAMRRATWTTNSITFWGSLQLHFVLSVSRRR